LDNYNLIRNRWVGFETILHAHMGIENAGKRVGREGRLERANGRGMELGAEVQPRLPNEKLVVCARGKRFVLEVRRLMRTGEGSLPAAVGTGETRRRLRR
jgi:hypothetical protein